MYKYGKLLLFTVYLIGSQDAGDVRPVLAELLVPVAEVLVGHLACHVKHLHSTRQLMHSETHKPHCFVEIL